MKKTLLNTIQWLGATWSAYFLINTLKYKFTGHPETLHIFNTIGAWIGNTLYPQLGEFFASYGAYITGAVELIISMLYIAALFIAITNLKRSPLSKKSPEILLYLAGLGSTVTLFGAMFFHLITPLGVVIENNGKSDGGALFTQAVIIGGIGLFIALKNHKSFKY